MFLNSLDKSNLSYAWRATRSEISIHIKSFSIINEKKTTDTFTFKDDNPSSDFIDRRYRIPYKEIYQISTPIEDFQLQQQLK